MFSLLTEVDDIPTQLASSDLSNFSWTIYYKKIFTLANKTKIMLISLVEV